MCCPEPYTLLLAGSMRSSYREGWAHHAPYNSMEHAPRRRYSVVLQPILPHTRAQLCPAEPQQLGGLRLVLVRLLEGLLDELLFQVRHGDATGRTRDGLAARHWRAGWLPQRLGQVLRRDY